MEDNMDKAAVQAAFVAAGISRLLKDIDYISRPSMRLFTTPVDESTLAIGTSKLGGFPDLPAGVTWPECKGQPQSFIGQIHLADIGPYDVGTLLPHSGMLWFFYDALQQNFGENPTDNGCWRVFFIENLSGLQRSLPPAQLPTAGQFKACSIRPTNEITLSQRPKLDVPNFDWTEAEQKKYETLLSTFPNSEDHAAIHNRLLGNPDTLQDDMRQQCQLVSHGITDDSDSRAAGLAKGAMDWLLLLQIDSDEHAGMRWGAGGMLYYWIKRDDLQARHFEHTWLVLQSE
jgi:uncharacterized protein YwqG